MLNACVEYIRQSLSSTSDPRISNYPFVTTSYPTVAISVFYVISSCIWRNLLVARSHTKQFKTENNSVTKSVTIDLLQCTMIVYNFLLALLSLYLLADMLFQIYKLGYHLGCIEMPDPTDRRTDEIMNIGYIFYISKIVELLDTVFFLLRGKVDQITFLHVFHHASMPILVWIGLCFAPGGLVFTFPLANCFVHVLMYTYYGLAAAGLYKYLWWKKYLTIAQMAQFVFLIVHQGQVFYRSTPCNYPKIFPAAVVFYSSLFFVLFANFYINAYWRKKRLAKCDAVATDGLKKHKEHDVVANGDVLVNGSISSNGHLGSSKSGDLRERKRRT